MRNFVACLRHEEPDLLGLGADAFREAGLELRYIDLWKGERLPPVDALAGLIVLGGEMNVDEVGRFPFLAAERALLRDSVSRGLPTLGICLGGQLIARAMGARVHAGVATELGFLPIHPTAAGSADSLLSVFAEGDRVFRWHRDGFDLPTDAVLLLSGAVASPNQAFRMADRCWALQFHPEITDELLEAWLKLSGEGLSVTYGRHATDVIEEAKRFLPAQQERARLLFQRFTREIETWEPAAAPARDVVGR